MASGRLQLLAPLPPLRICSCGQQIRWSHLEYLGRGSSVPVYTCSGCGLSYRGREGSRPPAARAAGRASHPLPDQGPPDNPVLDQATAERLRSLLTDQSGGGGPER